MKIQTETGIQFGTSEDIKTESYTKDFFLKIVRGKGHFTTKTVYRAVAFSEGGFTAYTGVFWDTFEEAFEEGRNLLEKVQSEFDEEIKEYERFIE